MFENLKKAMKSKTMWFAGALTAFGAVEANIEFVRPFVTPDTFGLFSVAVGAVVAALRIVTKEPLAEK